MAKPKHLILLHSISHPKMAPDTGGLAALRRAVQVAKLGGGLKEMLGNGPRAAATCDRDPRRALTLSTDHPAR